MMMTMMKTSHLSCFFFSFSDSWKTNGQAWEKTFNCLITESLKLFYSWSIDDWWWWWWMLPSSRRHAVWWFQPVWLPAGDTRQTSGHVRDGCKLHQRRLISLQIQRGDKDNCILGRFSVIVWRLCGSRSRWQSSPLKSSWRKFFWLVSSISLNVFRWPLGQTSRDKLLLLRDGFRHARGPPAGF